jgi:signal transduction histidine kinase
MNLHESLLSTQYTTLIENLQEGILLENDNGVAILINKFFCDLFSIEHAKVSLSGYKTNQILNTIKNQFVVPQQLMTLPIVPFHTDTTTLSDEIELLDGRFLERTTTPIFKNNVCKGRLWTYRDITAQKQLVDKKNKKIEELAVQNNIKSEFLSIISHDLRSPLGILKGYVDLLNSNRLSGEDAAFFQQHLTESLNATTSLLDNLLDWSKMQMAGNFINVQKTQISPIVDDCFALVKTIANEKGIELINKIPPATAVNTDANILRLVLRNLIGNAIKFTKSGSITVSRKYQNDSLEIYVADTGIGMTDDELLLLFNSQTDGRTMLKQNGTSGLGLFLCKEFVEKQGGEIWIESELGKGSTFCFTIPKYL